MKNFFIDILFAFYKAWINANFVDVVLRLGLYLCIATFVEYAFSLAVKHDPHLSDVLRIWAGIIFFSLVGDIIFWYKK